jgi:transposase, IS30 family
METILAWDSKSHGGKMPEGYLHLTCEQRCQIYALLQSSHSQAHIARTVGVAPSTISRELVRNTGERGYRFKQAHEKASQRGKEASDKPRKMTPDLVELVEEKLTQEQWSPDQTAAVWRRMASPLSATSASISMTGVSSIFTSVSAAKNTTSGRARIQGVG